LKIAALTYFHRLNLFLGLVAAPTAVDALRVFAITIMTTLDRDEVGKGMILVGEVMMGDGGIMMQFATKWKS
jgi:hypothetical protein